MQQYTVFALEHARLLYMIRVTLVMGFILFIIRMFDIPYGYWALITAVTILGPIPFIGGVLSKAKQRIIGTMIGAAIGLSLFLVPDQFSWTHHIMFLAMVVGAMYFTQEKYAYAAMMVAVTIVIVAGGGPDDSEAATWRIVNVLWAAVLAIIASLCIFPTRATRQFLYLFEQFLQESGRIYHQHNLEISQSTFQPSHASQLADLIDKQQSILPHVIKESGPNKQLFNSILSLEKRIYADLETLVSTLWDTQQGKDKISDMPGLTRAKEQLAHRFEQLAVQITDKSVLVVPSDDIYLLSLLPKFQRHLHDDSSDISYFGYLWLNREIARQFAQLTQVSSKLFRYQSVVQNKQSPQD